MYFDISSSIFYILYSYVLLITYIYLLGGNVFSQGLVVTIELTAVDISIIKLNPHLGKQPNDTYLAYPSTSMQDMAGNAVIPQLQGTLTVY